MPSYLVRAEEIPVQGEMRIQEHSSGDVWYSLSFCDHQNLPTLIENVQETVSSTKHKHDVKQQNLGHRKTAEELAIASFMLVNQLKVIKKS